MPTYDVIMFWSDIIACILEEVTSFMCLYPDIPWKHENLYDTNFVVIGDSGGCHDDNPRHHQWRQGWYYNNSRFSVIHCVVKDE